MRMTQEDYRRAMVPQKITGNEKAFGIWINQKKARLRGGYKRK